MPDTDRPIWFPAKRYGWGWGLPITWQGWVVLTAYALAMAGAGLGLMPEHPLAFAGVSLAASLALLVLCWFRGEPPRWRWGRD